MRKVGITGHTGSLGKTLIKNSRNIKFYRFKGDIRNRKKIFNWFKKSNLDVIIHFAAIVPIKVVNKDKKKAMQVNYHGTKNIVDAIVKNNIKWLFFSSTSHVYASSKKKINENSKLKPISYYGRTKLLAENYVNKKLNGKINYCIGRIFSTTNKNQKINYLVPDLKNKIKKSKKKIKLVNLNHYRDFISMHDISKIIYTLFNINYNGTINIGTGQKIHLKEVAKTILKKYKKKSIFQDNPKSTYLISNNSKLKKIFKLKLETNIEKLIF